MDAALSLRTDRHGELVRTGLPVVHQVVTGVLHRLPRSVERDELVSAGMVGLVQAARSFDPARGVSFSAYARTRVKGAVLDELRSLDAVSRRTRSRARSLEATAATLSSELGRTPDAAEIADRSGTSVAEVREVLAATERAAAMQRRHPAPPDFGVANLAAAELGPEERVLEAELRGYVADAVASLPERLRLAVIGYVCEGRPMKELAAELGVTESRVSQLCTEAIALLRDGINAQLEPATVPDLHDANGRAGRRKCAYYSAVAEASSATARLDRRVAAA